MRISTLQVNPIMLDEDTTEVQAATIIGISISQNCGKMAEQLIGNADKVMYAAKEKGKINLLSICQIMILIRCIKKRLISAVKAEVISLFQFSGEICSNNV